MKEPAVPAVDHDHFHAAQICNFRGIRKPLDNVKDRLLIQSSVILSQMAGGVTGGPRSDRHSIRDWLSRRDEAARLLGWRYVV